MITTKIISPNKGDFFQPTKSIRKEYFLGKFEAWFLYEEFIMNSSEFLKEKTKKDLIKQTGLSERKWDKAVSDLTQMGFLKLEKVSKSNNVFDHVYHFSTAPVKEWVKPKFVLPKKTKDSSFTDEEWREIHLHQYNLKYGIVA